jgi:hypothetical protein
MMAGTTWNTTSPKHTSGPVVGSPSDSLLVLYDGYATLYRKTNVLDQPSFIALLLNLPLF